jgi:enoyl-CoA hydratase
MGGFIRYEVTDGIGVLTINRPEKRNAMTYAMLGEFTSAINEAGSDNNTRVLVITGAGGAFCAGTDLQDLSDRPAAQRGARGRADERGRWWPIIECQKPVIGAIDGVAVGMGAEFTSQCDVRIASTRARFAWNFAHRGLVPDTGAGTWLLPRLIGPSRAMKLLFTGAFLSASEALAIGYVDKVVEPDALMNEALALAREIAKVSPFSNVRTKALLYEGLSRDVSEHMQAHLKALTECFASNDHKEGVASFLERREAKFTGT